MSLPDPDDPTQANSCLTTQNAATTGGELTADPPFTVKDILVHLGLTAWRDGNWHRVQLITWLIRERGLTHE